MCGVWVWKEAPKLASSSLGFFSKNYQHKSTDQEVGISQVLQKISLFTQFENDVEKLSKWKKGGSKMSMMIFFGILCIL